jgi:glyoxylase-like metal-dependent hydrolase (beta-lactamase superfamily II)
MRVKEINTGKFKLDGGAMFGVVPKSLWTRLNPADENNMCTWAMRCLYVEDGNRKILIDTGLGNKQDEKFRSHFYPHEDIIASTAIEQAGVKAEEITDVIITHFHFDHVGGAVVKDEQGKLHPAFPNARYWTNELHYQWAYDPNPRERASFLHENFVPLKNAGVLNFIDVQNGVKFSDNISFRFVYGHTEAMMLPSIHLPNGNKLHFCADLLPSHAHISMPYVMAYDVRPLHTLKEKAQFFEEMVTPGNYLFLEHDKDHACITLERNEKGRIVLGETKILNDIL